MTITFQLSSEDIQAIADAVAQRLRANDDELIDMYQAAKLLCINSDNPRNISSRMSKLSNPRYTQPPLPVYHNGGKSRWYKVKEIKEFMTRQGRNV